jgi:hypothetical protein
VSCAPENAVSRLPSDPGPANNARRRFVDRDLRAPSRSVAVNPRPRWWHAHHSKYWDHDVEVELHVLALRL